MTIAVFQANSPIQIIIKAKGVYFMASAQNKVISGYLSGHRIIVDGCPFIVQSGNALTGARGLRIIKPDVEDYEVLSEDKVRSGTSTILRGAAGAAILGPVGLLAAVSGKKKGIYCVALQWKSGQKSLIEIDDKIYKALVRSMF